LPGDGPCLVDSDGTIDLVLPERQRSSRGGVRLARRLHPQQGVAVPQHGFFSDLGVLDGPVHPLQEVERALDIMPARFAFLR
jgi:hypothetical protein